MIETWEDALEAAAEAVPDRRVLPYGWEGEWGWIVFTAHETIPLDAEFDAPLVRVDRAGRTDVGTFVRFMQETDQMSEVGDWPDDDVDDDA